MSEETKGGVEKVVLDKPVKIFTSKGYSHMVANIINVRNWGLFIECENKKMMLPWHVIDRVEEIV